MIFAPKEHYRSHIRKHRWRHFAQCIWGPITSSVGQKVKTFQASPVTQYTPPLHTLLKSIPTDSFTDTLHSDVMGGERGCEVPLSLPSKLGLVATRRPGWGSRKQLMLEKQEWMCFLTFWSSSCWFCFTWKRSAKTFTQHLNWITKE